MTGSRSLSETLEPQLEMLRRLAKFADEHGFCIVLYGPPERHRRQYSLITDKRVFCYIAGGMTRFVEEWGRVNATKLVMINVGEPRDAKVPLPFWFNVPRLKRFLPLIVALDMFASEKKGRYGKVYGNGFLAATRFTDRMQYDGADRAGLEVVVNTFQIPHHREILRHNYDRREDEG
jgi:hypothetical protein